MNPDSSTSILIGSNGSGGPATMFEDESSNDNQNSKNSNNASSFPSKLLSMLNESYDRGFSHIVSWQMNDAAFKVHSPSEFVKRVMPLYFNQTKYKSFQRQLNLYGFARITRGPNKGCYVHEMFQRCDECKCLSITRKRVTDPDEEYGDDYDLGLCLGAPTWLNHSSMLADVEPDPIADGAAGAAASNKPSNKPSNSSKNMLNAFENFFQSNVVGSSTSQGDDDLKKFKKSSSSSPTTTSSAAGGESCSDNKQQPQENALQRMLEGYLGPKPKEGEDRCNNGENQNQKNQEDHESTSNATGRKKYQRAAVFPDKLHDMLDYASQHNLEDVASWQMDGRAFKVHNISKFMTDIMPLFFKQSKYESLQRQLNLYGFTRVPKGPMKGCYHHPLFIKGGRELSSGMARRKQDDYDCSTNTCYPTDVVSSSSLNNSSNKSIAAIKKHQKQKKASSNKQEMTLKNLVRPDMIPSQQQRQEGRGSCLSMTTIGGDDSCLGNGWDPSMMPMAALPTPIASGNGSALPATIMDTSSGTNQNSGCGGNMLFSSNSNMTSVGAAVPSFSSSSVSPSINNIMMSSSSSATRQPASCSSLFEQDYFMSTVGSSSMNNSSGNNNIAGNTNNGNNCGFAAQPWAAQNNGLPPLPFDSMMNNSGNNNNVGSLNSNSINNNDIGGFAAQPWGHLARPMFPSNNNVSRRGGNLTRGVSDGSQQDMGSSSGNGNNGNGGNNMFAAMPWMQPQQQQQHQLPTMNNTNNNVVEGMFGFVPTVMTDFQNNM